MKAKRTLLAFVTVMLMTIMTVMPVSAASSSSYGDGVAAQDVEFNKILILQQGNNVPNVDFDFEVSVPENNIPATAATMAVLKGVGAPTIDTVSFTVGTSKDTTSKVSGYDTVTKTATVDFSGIEFNEPGIYRYYIKETANNNAVVYDVDATDVKTAGDLYRTLDVYVEDDTTTSLGLKVTAYVMYDGKIETGPAVPSSTETPVSGTAITTTAQVNTADLDDSRITDVVKTDNFMNYYDDYNVTFSKTVAGNQGSKDKYFEFTFTVNGLSAGTKYNVDITNAVANPSSTPATTVTVAANPTTVTADASGKIEQKFYLQHGQSIVIKGLAKGTSYTISENKEDYTATAVATEAVDDHSVNVSAGDTAVDEGIVGDTTIDFTNNRDGIIPTGIIISVAGLLIVGIIAVIGFVFFGVHSKRRYEED